MDLRLQGKHFLITGATRGIGRAIAEGFAAEGADVSICARDEGAVAETVTALRGTGVRAFGRALDVGDAEALTRFVTDAHAEMGRLDGLVASASPMASGRGIADFDAAYRVDLMHTRAAVEAALPLLETGGAITAISSISGIEDYGFDGVSYGTMKAALFFYVKSLARHVAPRGIRANVVSPGTILFPGGYWDKVRLEDPTGFQENVDFNPMGRMGTPEEIASVVVFLSSPRAGFVSGANVVVDGTATMRVQS
jgi:NAD(P)-dependent dehydrogenase (short-subunit alcohol dehydrogenase family)